MHLGVDFEKWQDDTATTLFYSWDSVFQMMHF